MKQWLTLGAAGLLSVALSGVALAQTNDGATQKEITTAHAHALMAQGAQSLTMTHTHLHHVINCLVGPDGQAFDADAGNPCKGMGDGALPDSKGNQDLHARLEKALTAASHGLDADKLEASQAKAAKAADLLQSSDASTSGY